MDSAYIYTNTEVMDIARDADIIFTTNGWITLQIKHNEGDEKIIFNRRGIYIVDFYACISNMCLSGAIFGITINGRLVANSLSRTNDGIVLGQAVIQIEEGDILRIRNCSGKPLYFNCFAGGQEKNIRASITINQIE